ncbi:hypothetical protein BOX15_Mlig003794g1 [Macrostomum lignano]|uniref:TLC domain-containing protein n=1 Tax=Macrostomum lignano TaxID=282301 RepID=A0A267EGW3_9PLAT|nr:hypothetical protein BOX15_Mlig003794g1 [Macrostomum lignano]
MTYMKPGKKKNKNVSYFSNEYIITNHGDIVSFIAMIIVLGLMFQFTAPIAKLFIIIQHNATVNATTEVDKDTPMYTTGRRDLLAVIFYTLIAIVIHAVIQEYILDKVNRKLHLSKTKHSKVNESGHLALFYIISAVWGANIIYRERLFVSVPSLWEGYPHMYMSFWFKFYFICQICYWLHCFPELYFQRIKKDEMPSRVTYYSIYLVCILGAYLLHFNRLAIVLLVVHYFVESIYHASRLFYFFGKTDVAKAGFLVWDVLFVLVRVLSVALAFITFMLGLERSAVDSVAWREGNFNTRLVRVNCLMLLCLLQGYLMWNFITFHIKRIREYISQRASRSPRKQQKKLGGGKSKADGEQQQDGGGAATNELTEVDRDLHEQRKKRA